MLDARLDLRVGDFHLDVALRADAGEVVAVLGPNGAGKTTLLRALAGLQPGGRISVGGRTLDGLPPEQRSVGVVFQEYLLFPHLSVRDNVAFGASRAAADGWLERVGLADRAAARPAELSGGQAQRVALARALAREPDLLLLDEPLAALDAGTRNEIRRELHRHLTDFPGVAVLVTHDPVDAFALADRVMVLEGGRVVQEGPPAELGTHPRSPYVAELVGTNLVTGTCRGGVVDTAAGGRLVVASPAEGAVLAVIAPSAISLHRRPPEGSPRNVWQGRVTALDRLVDRVHVHVDGAVPVVAAVVPAAVVALGLRTGEEVWVAIKATEIEVHPV